MARRDRQCIPNPLQWKVFSSPSRWARCLGCHRSIAAPSAEAIALHEHRCPYHLCLGCGDIIPRSTLCCTPAWTPDLLPCGDVEPNPGASILVAAATVPSPPFPEGSGPQEGLISPVPSPPPLVAIITAFGLCGPSRIPTTLVPPDTLPPTPQAVCQSTTPTQTAMASGNHAHCVSASLW